MHKPSYELDLCNPWKREEGEEVRVTWPALAEDLGSTPITHMATTVVAVTPVCRDLMPSSICLWYTDKTRQQNTYTQKLKIF